MLVARRPVALAYHGVSRLPDPSTLDPRRLVIDPDLLAAHIQLLRRLGYRFATAEQLSGTQPPPRGTAVLTFDDGFADWVAEALPVLQAARVSATFYVCPGLFGTQHPDVSGPAGRLLDEQDLRRIVDAGMAVGSHASTHVDLRGCDDRQLAAQLGESRAEIARLTGDPCSTFAYPYGLHDDRVRRAVVAAGYRLAWSWRPGPWRPYAAPRLPAPNRHGAARLGWKLLGVRRFWAD